MQDSNPSAIGARAEAAVAAALVAAGNRVFVPLFDTGGRTDLVVDDGASLRRVQCKSARRLGDVIVFPTCSNTNQQRKSYRGEVDLFGVYAPDLDRVFLVPVDAAPLRACYLRLRPARNGQADGIRWAAEFVVGGPLDVPDVVG